MTEKELEVKALRNPNIHYSMGTDFFGNQLIFETLWVRVNIPD